VERVRGEIYIVKSLKFEVEVELPDLGRPLPDLNFQI